MQCRNFVLLHTLSCSSPLKSTTFNVSLRIVEGVAGSFAFRLIFSYFLSYREALTQVTCITAGFLKIRMKNQNSGRMNLFTSYPSVMQMMTPFALWLSGKCMLMNRCPLYHMKFISFGLNTHKLSVFYLLSVYQKPPVLLSSADEVNDLLGH